MISVRARAPSYRRRLADLDSKTLRAISCVNKRFNKLIGDKLLWKKVIQREHDSRIIKNLEHIDEFIENIWKTFTLANLNISSFRELSDEITEKSYGKRKISNMSLINQEYLSYFQNDGDYIVWTLSKYNDSTELVLVLKENIEYKNGNKTTKFLITEYCGFINKHYVTKKGKISSQYCTYIGELKDGYLHGNGKLIIASIGNYEDGDYQGGTYKGQFKNGHFDGEGILEYDDGFYYSDCWSDSNPIRGTLMYKQGGYFTGDFVGMICSNGIHVGRYGYILETKNCDKGQIDGICNLKDSSGHLMNIEFTNNNINEPVKVFRSKLNPSILKCIKMNICTRAFTGKIYYPQIYYRCLTCDLTDIKNLGICEVCANICHKNHKINPIISDNSGNMSYAFYCGCHIKSLCICFELNRDYSNIFDNIARLKIAYHDKLPI